MKLFLRLYLILLFFIFLTSCATGMQGGSGAFYNTGSFGKVGNFSGADGSHGDLVALLKSPSGSANAAASSGMRGIQVKSRSAQTPAADSAANYSQNYAIVIGIDDYRYWPKLFNARNDAYAMEKVLKSLGFNVYHLYDRQATREKIQSAITDIIGKKADSNDRVVIFYAGHGHTLELEGGGNLGYIVPVGGKTSEYGTLISMTNLLDWSRIIKARELLFIMDSCYSGTGKLTELTLRETSTADSECRSRQIITAGQKDQQVFDSTVDGVRHSVFTNYLISALRDNTADSDRDGHTDATELGTFLRDKVTGETSGKQAPDFGKLPGHKCGDYVFYPQDVQMAEEKVQEWCEVSPEYLALEFNTKINISGTVNSIKFNPVYGNLVAIATTSKFVLYDIDRGEEVLSFDSPKRYAAFSPNGKCLLTVGNNGTLRFYDVLSGEKIYTIKSPIRSVHAAEFSPNASRLGLAGEGKIVVWDIIANVSEPMVGNHGGKVHSIKFVNNKSVFSVSDNMTGKLWNIENQQEMKRIDESSGMNKLYTAAFSPNGELVVLGLKQVNINLMKGTRTDFEYIRLRNTDTGDELWKFEGHTKKITALAFHPNKQFFASGSADKEIKFWDIRDQKRFKKIPASATVDEVSFSPNGCYFAAASAGEVSIWRLSEDRGM